MDHSDEQLSADEAAGIRTLIRRLDAAFGPIGEKRLANLTAALSALDSRERIALVSALLRATSGRHAVSPKWIARSKKVDHHAYPGVRKASAASVILRDGKASSKTGRGLTRPDASLVCEHGKIKGKCSQCR